MKPCKPTATLMFLSLALFSAAAPAQGVYVTRGENGPVFSDKPQAGSREVILKPLNVVPSQPEPQPAAKAAPDPKPSRQAAEAAAPFYRSLSIVSPENNGSVAGNSATFEVRLASDPPLALGDGHSFLVRINGRFVDQRFTSTEFVIPPEFWAEGYVPANQTQQLDASIVDASGQVLVRAAPVIFHTRQVIVHPGYYPGYPPGYPGRVQPPHPRPPLQPQRPPAKPKPGQHAADFPGGAIKP